MAEPKQNPPPSSSPLPTAAEPRISADLAYEKAWKHVGYRGYSRLLGSHEHFLHVRLFRTLNARVILAMQDHISVLERNLDKLEADLSAPGAPDTVHNGTFRRETSKERFKLVWEIRKRLKDYNDYILSYSQLSARNRVDGRDTESVRYWLSAWPNAIRDEEVGYLEDADDLVYVTEKSYGSLRRGFRKLCLSFLPFFRKRPALPRDLEFIMDNIELHDNAKADGLLVWILIVVALGMLIAPLWVLSVVQSNNAKLGVITGCITMFLAAVAVTTNAKASESLAATAG